ncbi:hypothetical protein PCI56_08955 [Plesiomonas shigelloides subsp. oncorhynchi]|nr:hypothetical protein [Plesiomonas shigelloides]
MTQAVTTSRWARFKNSDIVYYFLRDKVAMFCFVVFLVYVLAAMLAPWIAPHNVYDPTSFDLMDAEMPPSWLDGGDPRFGSALTTKAVTSGAPFCTVHASHWQSAFCRSSTDAAGCGDWADRGLLRWPNRQLADAFCRCAVVVLHHDGGHYHLGNLSGDLWLRVFL